MKSAIGAALLGLLLALAAAAFGTASLYVPGLALLVLGFGGAAWVLLAASGASLERTLGAPAVEEEDPYVVRLNARTGPLPAPGGELVEPLVERPLSMLGRRARRVTVRVRFARRGRRVLAPARLVVRDPLGLATRTVASAPSEVLVLPRIEPVRVTGAGGSGHTGEAGLLAVAAAELELDSLRPYRPGAPASRIHWPTVARSREIMERRLVADEDRQPLVVVDARTPASEDALDRAVRAAGSLAVHLAREGGCAVLLPGDRRATPVAPDLRAWPALHARLAVVESGDEPPAVARVARGGAVFWVSATRGGDAPVGLRRTSAPVRYLVSPMPRTLPVGFSVAGCHGYRLGRTRERAAA